MYTLEIGKRKYKPNPFFGALGFLFMLPALALMLLSVIILVILMFPGFAIAMIGATRSN